MTDGAATLLPTRLGQVLRALDERPTAGAYHQAARAIRDLDPAEGRPVRVALLASFTIDPLVPYLQVEAARHGFLAVTYVAPFNSVSQELLDPRSGCAVHEPEVVFIAQLLEDACPALADRFLSLDAAAVDSAIESHVSALSHAVTTFRRSSQAAIVIHNFALPARPLLGLAEPTAVNSQTDAIRRANAAVAAMVRGMAGAYVLDYDRVSADVGYRQAVDLRMWYLGRGRLAAAMLPRLASAHAAITRALLVPPRKCLVVDLDNTLWGDVIGEVGVAGVKLGQTYPGNAFVAFQRALADLKRRGVLLAINSKNGRADVEEIFSRHPDMVLKLEDFSSVQVNWADKPANMIEIARELNIGLSSLAFFDDNPAERALMRHALPDVLTLDVPDDPTRYIDVVAESGAFEKLSVTDEDRRRAEMYRDETARHTLSRSFSSVPEFLAALEMEATVAPVDQWSLPRVADLIQKTNQFNVTSRRHSAAALEHMLHDPAQGVFSLHARDRFGDHGIVGTAILHIAGKSARIDTFLLSCRVIGRTLETALLAALGEWARAQGATVLEGEFIPTAKNTPAAGFFESHGFDRDGQDGRWSLPLDRDTVSWPSYIVRKSGSRASSAGQAVRPEERDATRT